MQEGCCQGLVEDASSEAAKPTSSLDDGFDDNINGKVLWLSAQKGWCVVYTNATGARRPKTGPAFRVPFAHPTGVPLTPAEVRHDRDATYVKSVEAWNEFDKSLVARFRSDA